MCASLLSLRDCVLVVGLDVQSMTRCSAACTHSCQEKRMKFARTTYSFAVGYLAREDV